MIFKSVIVRSAVCAAIACAAIGANSANATTVDFTLTQGSKTDSWSLDANTTPLNQNSDIYYEMDQSRYIYVFPQGLNMFSGSGYGSDSQTANVPWFEMAGNTGYFSYTADFSTDRPFFKTLGTQSFISGTYQLTQYGPYYFGGSGPATLTIGGGLPSVGAPEIDGGKLPLAALLLGLVAVIAQRKRKVMLAA